MPSLLGRFVGLSFRTELLIMNIFGLVNSTLDWSPLKWTNKLEQIWNLSMPQKSLIVDTIGEDAIKTILSWIVITRIVIAHVYTFTYLSNIYPIITWSSPNLLLPWLILSFFKNVVLEVIVIVIGLLLWYGSPFSLVVFLEFIFIKLIPLVMASYNWYSNSCLFLQLRQAEKMRKLHRSMRSDSNLLTNQLYVKIDEPRYRSGSLTTLFSYDSCETYNPALTPGQNAKKLLGITEQDVADALDRIKEREAHKRLTELDDDDDLVGGKSVSKGYFFGSNLYTGDILTDDISDIFAINQEELKNLEDFENTKNDDDLETPGNPGVRSSLNALHESPTNIYEDESIDQQESEPVKPYSGAPETVEKLENPASDNPKNNEEEDTDVSTEVLASKKRKSLELLELQKVKQRRSSVQEKDIKLTTRSEEETHVNPKEDDVRSVKRSPSPANSQAVFNCSCTRRAKSDFKESHTDTGKTIDMRTSTPRERSENDEDGQSPEKTKKSSDQPYTHAYSLTEIKTNCTMNNGLPLMEKMLKNDLEILKSMKMEEQRKNSVFNDIQDFRKAREDKSNILDDYGGHINESVDVRDISDIVKDLSVSMHRMTIGTNRSDNETLRSNAWYRERGASNNPNMPRFYQDFMKIFDGCYQNDFANNSELQCVFQQMEKKKWNLFSGQTNLETLLTTGYPDQNYEEDKPPRYDSSGSISHRTVHIEDSDSPKMEAARRPPEKRLLQIEDFVKPITMKPMKNIGTQTMNYVGAKSLNSNESVRSMDAKTRWRYFSRRNRLQYQKGSGSQMSNTKLAAGKKDFSSSLHPRMRSNSPHASKSPPRKLNESKSFSNRRDCECKMEKQEKKYSPSTDSSYEKREKKRKAFAKPKVDSLATLPLAQVTRKPEANAQPFRVKPPVYPKKNMKEAHTAAAVDKSWKSFVGKGTEQTESKKSIDGQSTSSSKRTARSMKWSRKRNEELAAQELRALKAYNEITLLEDKKKLDAKRRTLDRLASDRDGRGSHKRIYTRRDLGKENLSTDSANAISSSSRNNKLPLNAAGKHVNPKSSKVAKPADKQKNLDSEAAERIRYVVMHASRMYGMSKAAIPPGTSDMKLEGAETGRDLERSKAKEDVRSSTLSAETDVERSGSTVQNWTSEADADGLEPEDKQLLTLVKKSAEEDAASTRSSSSDDFEAAAAGSSREQQCQDLLREEEESAEVLEDFEFPSDGISEKEESIERRAETSENLGSVERQDEDVGNVIVVCQDNSVVPWKEQGSTIPTMLQSLYSFRLMDSLLKPPSRFILNDSKVDESSRLVVPTIPKTEDLGQAQQPMTVGNVAVDQKIASVDLETKSRTDDREGGFDLSIEQIDDILRSVVDVLKSLNILENAELQLKKDDAISWLKKEIFTDIKFPIVIKAAEISPDILGILDVRLSSLLTDQGVEFREPIGMNLVGLTVITEEDEGEAEAASTQGPDFKNTLNVVSSLPSSLKLLSDSGHSALDITNTNVVSANYSFVSSLDMEYTADLGSPIFEQDVGVDLNKTYEILKGCSDEDTGVTVEEVDDVNQFSEMYDSEMSKVVTSIELEKLENDQSETSDAAVEEIITRLVRSVKMDVEEFEEERVHDEEFEEKRNEVDSESDVVDDDTRDEELLEDSVDEGIDELSDQEVESSLYEEEIRTLKIVNSFQSKEIDEVEEDVNCRSVTEQTFEQSCEDDGEVRKLDKHEQEEKIVTGVYEESICTTETKDSVRDEDVTSTIGVDQSSSSMGKCEEKERNIRLLESSEDAEKREKPRSTDTAGDTMATGADEKVSLIRIFIFFLQVWYLYIRHFYRKICSFAQISRATSTLKPFEVHTVSTSTSTFIERTGLVDTTQDEESLVEEGEETYEISVDFETMNISRVIEERLQGVLDLTAERCTSGNSDFEAEEMSVALRRETVEMGLSSSVSFVEEIPSDEMDTEFSNMGESLRFGEQTEEIQAFRFKDFDRSGSPIYLRSESLPNRDHLGRNVVEVQNTIRELELNLTVDVGKDEGSSKDGQTTVEEDKKAVEETEDASAVQFETTLEDMDSFNSIYTIPSRVTKLASCSKLDNDDDMEEFSAASSTTSVSTQ